MTGAATGALRYVALDEWSGYGESARRLVAGLRSLGVAVDHRAWSAAGLGAPGSAGTTVDDDAPVVAHLVPELYPRVRAAVDGAPMIAHTVWETDRLPAHWPALLNEMDLVVVPCAWNRDVFSTSGVTTPIAAVPHVACVPRSTGGEARIDLADDVVVFYTIARWDERKAPCLTVRAFLEAFDADDPVVLVVKTGPRSETLAGHARIGASPLPSTTAWEVAQLVREYRHPADVRLELADWSDAQIAGLHARGDCFVSLTRGEGWGLGSFDAAAYGNPVVTTGWGGVLDYLDRETAWLVDFDLVPVRHPVPTSYSPDQRWAEARLDDAVAALREIAADRDAARRRAAPLARRIGEEYDAVVVAQRFLESVAAVA